MTKTTIALVAASLALVAVAPVAGAYEADDVISRMFPYISGARAEVAGNGIGWYDNANPPNLCAATFVGIETRISAGFYHEQLRIWPNLPGHLSPVTFGSSLSVPFPCPPAPVLSPMCTLASICAIHLEPLTVGPSARTIAPQDGIPCSQASSFITCIVTDSQWRVSGCPWNQARFIGRDQPPNDKDENKGVLSGTGINHVFLSKDIDCGFFGGAYDGFYDVSYLLGNPSLYQSGFDGVTASLVIPYGDGKDDTGFLVSCLELETTEIDTSTPIPTVTQGVVEDGVDWFQVVDLDALFLGTSTNNWVGGIFVLLGSGINGQLLAGLYDLGGYNDCDFGGGALPQCHDGIDNDNDGAIDENDFGCYSADPNLGGIPYYNARDNSE